MNADSNVVGCLYNYCKNSPIYFFDNSGREAESSNYRYCSLEYEAEIVDGGARLYQFQNSDIGYHSDDFYNGFVPEHTRVTVHEQYWDHPDDKNSKWRIDANDRLPVSITTESGQVYNGYIKRSNIDVSASNMTAEEAFGTETIRKSTFGKKDYPDRRVWNLQQYLNRYNSLKIKVDGYWGEKTRDAIVSFQKSRGLKVDGEAGVATWEELIK